MRRRLILRQDAGTGRLRRAVYPELSSHRLDVLLDYLQISHPAGRHRAMPDVLATAELFTRIALAGSASGRWRTLNDLAAAAGLPPRQPSPAKTRWSSRGGALNARLISVEGISGVGKTTLARPFVELLRAQGHLVVHSTASPNAPPHRDTTWAVTSWAR